MTGIRDNPLTGSFPAHAVFLASRDAVVIMGADGIVRGWNPAAERTFGYTSAEAVGRELAELIVPGPLRAAHRNALQRYLETGDSTILDRRLQMTGLRSGGDEFPVELTVTRIAGADPPLFAGFVRDITESGAGATENARLQQRMAFLAQAGLVLDSSLDLHETLANLAHLTVPELAQLTVIDLAGEDGTVRTAVAAAQEPQYAFAVEQMRRDHPLRASSAHPVVGVLRSGKAMLLSEMSPDYQRRIAADAEHFTLMRQLRYHSAIVVPLIARQRVLGALSLLRLEGAIPYDEDDLVLCEELARRAGLAVDNARLFQATRSLARTLQESLLPASLPEIPGVRLTARYRPAEQGQQVGGDFYDAFVIAPDRWGIAIGDVCGKGPRAAALTALARYTVRAVADTDAAEVLRRLNQAALRDRAALADRFLTAVFALATKRDERLELSLAAGGHPPPVILRADGRAEQVAVSGPLIGIASEAAYEPACAILEPGDAMLLYTDGLTEARAPHRFLSESDLLELLARCRGLSGERLAESLERGATEGQDPRDDIAMLLIEVPG
jgi:PAS domain S-box-containing protein